MLSMFTSRSLNKAPEYSKERATLSPGNRFVDWHPDPNWMKRVWTRSAGIGSRAGTGTRIGFRRPRTFDGSGAHDRPHTLGTLKSHGEPAERLKAFRKGY